MCYYNTTVLTTQPIKRVCTFRSSVSREQVLKGCVGQPHIGHNFPCRVHENQSLAHHRGDVVVGLGVVVGDGKSSGYGGYGEAPYDDMMVNQSVSE